MNLNQLFNFNYLMQNLKKSKGPLALFIGFVPVLNIIIFLLMAQITDSTGVVPQIESLSIINFVGMYAIPLVLSITMFSFIFKKKSVDFINSMPLNRKIIFVTNTIGGILILIAMVLVNVILVGLMALIFSHVYIPIAMLFDYLIIWIVTYIFVFTVANLATSVSGNGVTQLVVTALLLFFIPFVYDYTSIKLGNGGSYVDTQIVCKDEACKPIQYLCYEDTKCELDRSLNIYRAGMNIKKNSDFTAPYGFPRNVVMEYDDFKLFNGGQLLKMFILSIVYFIAGLFAFRKRKMEVSQTSFKSINVHNIVKCLTLVPIGFGIYELFNESYISFIAVLFILALVLIYYFVYDLITRKSISQVARGLITLVIAAIIIFGYAGIVDAMGTQRKSNKFEVADINSVAIVPRNYDYNDGSNKLDDIFVSNKELINLVVKNILTTDGYWEYNGDMETQNEEYESQYGPINYDKRYEFYVTLNNKNNRQYTTTISVDEVTYKKIIEILSKDKNYVKAYKDLDYDDIYAVKINEFSSNASESKEIIDLIKAGMDKLDLYDYYTSLNRNYMMIELYVYKNHSLETYRISASINKELHQKIISSSNEQLKNALNRTDSNGYHNIWLEDTNSINILNAEESIDKIYYILDNSQDELFMFVNQHIKEDIDVSKPYIVFALHYNDVSYRFYTNNIDAVRNFVNERLEYLKTTEDYNNIYNEKYNKKVDYID